MNRRLVLSLLAATVLFYACRPRTHNEAATTSRAKASPNTPLVSDLDVRVSNGVTFALRVTNNTPKKLELNFPSGQTHEFYVVDSVGREVWRWSVGRMFTQALQNQPMDARESVTYEDRWSSPSLHGKYTAVAVLRSENYPIEQRTAFTLP